MLRLGSHGGAQSPARAGGDGGGQDDGQLAQGHGTGLGRLETRQKNLMMKISARNVDMMREMGAHTRGPVLNSAL